MRYALLIVSLLLASPAAFAQGMSPVQQYLQNETGYYAPNNTAVPAAPVPSQPAYVAPQPNYVQAQPLSPMQQYLQNEAGYAPNSSAYVPPVAVAPPLPTSVATSDTSITGGISGMNF